MKTIARSAKLLTLVTVLGLCATLAHSTCWKTQSNGTTCDPTGVTYCTPCCTSTLSPATQTECCTVTPPEQGFTECSTVQVTVIKTWKTYKKLYPCPPDDEGGSPEPGQCSCDESNDPYCGCDWNTLTGTATLPVGKCQQAVLGTTGC